MIEEDFAEDEKLDNDSKSLGITAKSKAPKIVKTNE